MLNHLIVSSIN